MIAALINAIGKFTGNVRKKITVCAELAAALALYHIIDCPIEMPFAYQESFGAITTDKVIRGNVIDWEISQRGVETCLLRSPEKAAAYLTSMRYGAHRRKVTRSEGE